MSVEEFDRFNDNSLILMFVFGLPLLLFFGMFILPELIKMPEPFAVILGFPMVLVILFYPPKVAYFILRKSNPYIPTKNKKGD